MNILIYIVVGFIAILLTVLEGIKWHIGDLVKKEDYCKARWWTIFLGKKWEYRVRYEYYISMNNSVVAQLLLKALLEEVDDVFLTSKIQKSLKEMKSEI